MAPLTNAIHMQRAKNRFFVTRVLKIKLVIRNSQSQVLSSQLVSRNSHDATCYLVSVYDYISLKNVLLLSNSNELFFKMPFLLERFRPCKDKKSFSS